MQLIPWQVQAQAGRQGGEANKSQYDKCSISDFSQGPILGTGSFGRVLLASHKQSGRVCAIKALSKAHLVKSQQARFHEPESMACASSNASGGGD